MAPDPEKIDALKSAYREAAALSSWTVIKLIENNQDFFEDRQEILKEVSDSLERGMRYAEAQNHRVSFIWTSEVIRKLIREHQELVTAHGGLRDAVLRLNKLEEEQILPLSDYIDYV